MASPHPRPLAWNVTDTGCWEITSHVPATNGYVYVARNGTSYCAHRLWWIKYYGKIPEEMCVLHHCDNQICINPDHLFLGTDADNIADMDTKGRRGTLIGKEHPNTKLTDAQVVKIRRLYHRTGYSNSNSNRLQLALKFSVSESCIGKIINGTRRRTVK